MFPHGLIQNRKVVLTFLCNYGIIYTIQFIKERLMSDTAKEFMALVLEIIKLNELKGRPND